MAKFYSLKPILERDCKYSLIIGERSNGKTFSVLSYAIQRYFKAGEQLGLVRRWREDFIGNLGQAMFSEFGNMGLIDKWSNGEWTDVYYYSSRWYFCRYDEKDNRIKSEEPFAYGFALSSAEHYKSTNYPKITTILFDEFIASADRNYIPEEFTLFTNVLSTIIRNRDNVRIFMLGNTVNKYCPYFGEMGLKHVRNMEQGTIDVYEYGDSGLSVAVEYCAPTKKGKPSDKYFAFDNPKLKMITQGGWEMSIYPRIPCHYKPKDVVLHYYINFDTEWLHCEIVSVGNNIFTFVHPKTTPLSDKDANTVIIYSQDFDPRPNWRRKITNVTDEADKVIAMFFRKDKIFFSDNETGELLRNYLVWCRKA